MKGAVHKANSHTLLELKEAIANFIRNIPPIELSRVFANKTRRADTCVYEHMGAIPNICCNLCKRGKCISVNVQGFYEHTHRLR
jgi:hypothetical protein